MPSLYVHLADPKVEQAVTVLVEEGIWAWLLQMHQIEPNISRGRPNFHRMEENDVIHSVTGGGREGGNAMSKRNE